MPVITVTLYGNTTLQFVFVVNAASWRKAPWGSIPPFNTTYLSNFISASAVSIGVKPHSH